MIHLKYLECLDDMQLDFIFFNDSIHAGCCYAQKNSKEAFM